MNACVIATELVTGQLDRKLPMKLGLFLFSFSHNRLNIGSEFLLRGDAPVQALLGEG